MSTTAAALAIPQYEPWPWWADAFLLALALVVLVAFMHAPAGY